MKIIFLIGLLFSSCSLFAEFQQPPYEEKNWETNENMRNIMAEISDIRRRMDKFKLPVCDVSVTTPTETGLMVRTALGVVYVSTGVVRPSDWSKVGAQ